MWCFGATLRSQNIVETILKRFGIEGDTPVDEMVWDPVVSRVTVLGSGQ